MAGSPGVDDGAIVIREGQETMIQKPDSLQMPSRKPTEAGKGCERSPLPLDFKHASKPK